MQQPTSQEWEAKPGEILAIPQELIDALRYNVIVFAGKKPFEFQCVSYDLLPRSLRWLFKGVVLDTSKRVPPEPGGKEVQKLLRLTYHPYIELVNVGFMVIPLPSSSPKSGD